MNIISDYNKKEPQFAALLRLNMFQIVTEQLNVSFEYQY